MAQKNSHKVAIVAGTRTPFAKAGTVFKDYSALDLGVHAVKGLFEKHDLAPESVDELVYGIVIHNPRIPNIAREVVFKSSLPSAIRAHTVSNNCITGIHAITAIYDSIVNGRTEIGIAGGTESMSNPPILFGKKISRIFLDLSTAKTFGARLANLAKIRPWHFKPSAPSVAEPSTGLTMGEHCEIMAKEWKIPREEQDEIALRSHQNARAATEDGRLKCEIYPLEGVETDLLIRADTSKEKLAKLPPVFDRENGTISAGNSSPLTDGASAVLLMSEERAKKEGREPLAFIRDFEYAAIDPNDGLLMAPCVAVPRLLKRTGLRLSDIDIIEVHEAFGAQIACNIRAWEKGWKEQAIGKIDREKLNPLGSSIAAGHPFAATGGRIVTTLANEMKRRNSKYGLVSICAAGAMAAAMILERS
ncbi:acetyl-CoA C-acyltransferase [candidate division KSB1 bacterium]|nr:acetyl-CoA C-acyltransferase [candidate division KSB1 bacterium]NIR71859.1 acetyl-CoA C-acyltransferase [candidate division KSB1 bacterium]NIS25375.1 acetyl-CoA C-acyltransferase [candidate division KSB1 bacterium]NIT71845.1 acetyl-CoA C-acyltransferase [candidate division KSB1 bacterium]NIU25583.1 acetyl-CoA C-acyltransferase [candidate division KSB1 bacterium]